MNQENLLDRYNCGPLKYSGVADQKGCSRAAILNIAASGGFSSELTTAEYAKEIWRTQLYPVD